MKKEAPKNIIACPDPEACYTATLTPSVALAWFFQELQDLESLLRGGYQVRILRSVEKKMLFSVLAIGETKAVYAATVKVKEIATEFLLLSKVNEIYSALDDAGLIDPKKKNSPMMEE